MFNWFFELSLPFQILLSYFLLINIITFCAFALDKMKSRRSNAQRIRERTLWLCTFLGGSPAALLAMNYFRHKTKKRSFQAVMIVIIALQVAAVFFLYNFLETKNNPIF